MNTPQHATRQHTLVALALQAWEQEGHALATDTLLRIRQLLDTLPPDTPDATLRHTLGCLLATSEAGQGRFYQLFDTCCAQADALCQAEAVADTSSDTTETSNEAGERRWTYRLWALSALLLLAGGWGLWKYLEPEVVAVQNTRTLRTEGATAAPGVTLRQPMHRDTARLLRAEPTALMATPAGNTFYMDSTGMAHFRAAADAPANTTDTAHLYLHYADGTDSVQWLVTINNQPPPDTTLAAQPLPYPADITPLLVDEADMRRYEWFRRYEWPLKVLLLLLAGLLGWGLLRLWQYRRARVVAELQQSKNAPYLWQPATQADAGQWVQDAAQPLLNRLRGRAPDDRLLLDLPATVQATIRRAGRVSFRYRRRTLPPAYLLLIDRHGADDHRARLFDALYQAMLAAEVPVSRFFYHGDPRLCFNEAHPHGIALVELQHHFADTRLLVVGSGQGLLSVATGNPAPWTSLLEAWQHRALLTTRARADWSLPEQQLARLLLLLPATEEGLGLALEAFLAEEHPTQQQLMELLNPAQAQGVTFQGDLLDDLRASYDEPMLDWIAACAVWPTLHWDLTLHLDACIADHHAQPLVGFERMRSLGMLPWFAQGRMPERARLLLLEYLHGRGLEEKVRLALRQLLAQSKPPPPDAVAYGDYRMNLILNELMLRPNPATRRRLEEEFANWLAAGKQPDFVALRLLDRPTTRLDVLVGNRLKKYAFREGMPGLGWQRMPLLLALWAVLAAALLLRPDLAPCDGHPATWQGQPLCLATAQDSLLLLRIQAAEAVQAQDTVAVDSLRILADAIVPAGDEAFYLNTAAHFYNYGLTHVLDANGQACQNFSFARQYSNRILYNDPSLYQLAMLLHCKGEDLPNGAIDAQAILASAGKRYMWCIDAAHGKLTAGKRSPLLPDSTVLYEYQLSRSVVGKIIDQLAKYGVNHFEVTPEVEVDDMLEERANRVNNLRTDVPKILLSIHFNAMPSASRDSWGASEIKGVEVWHKHEVKTGMAMAKVFHRYLISETGLSSRGVKSQEAMQFYLIRKVEATVVQTENGFYNNLEEALLLQTDEMQQLIANAHVKAILAIEGLSVNTAITPSNVPRPLLRDGKVVLSNDAPPAIATNMIRIPGDSYTMGCLDGRDTDCYEWEKPSHEVTVSTFSISKYEVTQAQWRAVMGSDPDELYNTGCDQCPVENVSWNDIQAFLQKLNAQTGQKYRLPTEAEWEYAARGGNKSQNYLYSGSNKIGEVAWYDGNYKDGNTHGTEKTTRPVGGLQANELGLYDMSGNVYEWCEDDWHGNYNNGAPTDGSAWVDRPRGTYRVTRGGSWISIPQYCRAAYRYNNTPALRSHSIGFRLAR